MATYQRPLDQLPDKWYKNIEIAKERATAMLKKVGAIHQTNSIVVGRFSSADIERLWQVKYPYCKISMQRALRFNLNGKLEANLGDEGVFWVNHPGAILSVEELSRRFPKVYNEVLPKIKTNTW